ncbi:MAG: pentapeptide repeat-containing protein, partial [Pseudonocardiaceae bacterium]
MNTKQLKQRWKDDRELANATTAWLGDTSLPIPAGISQVDGLIDLRGLPTFPAGPVRKITSTRWDHLDLSHSDLSGLQLRDVEITDCRLDQANLKRAHLINVECSRTTLV